MANQINVNLELREQIENLNVQLSESKENEEKQREWVNNLED